VKEQNNKEKLKISQVSRAVLSLLVVGFSIISILNVYKFLVVLFGLPMAILISSTLEITRLACLYTFLSSKKGIRSLAVAIYMIVVMVILFGNINSFTYEIIKRDRASQGQYRDQIHLIKQAHSRKIEEKITALERDVTYIEKMMAKYHGRLYWERRLSQTVMNRDKLITQRDEFLNTIPENPAQWIKSNSAMLGLELDNPSRDSEDMISVTQALKELWGLEKATAQKIMGIVITITVELSILLLSFLANAGKKSRSVIDMTKSRGVIKGRKNHGSPGSQGNVKKKITTREDLLNMITPDIDEITLEKFLAANRIHFDQTGELLPMRKLSMNLRPVRKIFEGFDRESLEKLFEK
jgi:energy-coupling factor transporter transmembrane protein EcfT